VSSPGERIGVFGGTFDPPHNGHLVAALAARRHLSLDRVLMVVAADPWQKRGAVVADAATRLELVEAACEGIDGLVPCDLEVQRGGPTYTIDTIEQLRTAGRDLVVVLGADAVAGLDAWHRAEELAALVSIASVRRAAGDAQEFPRPSARWAIHDVVMPRLDITSTALRAACAAGAPIDGLAPSAVVRAVHARRLYTQTDDRGVGTDPRPA
jgi:nicotinate-nucleotide adenylyltransferase